MADRVSLSTLSDRLKSLAKGMVASGPMPPHQVEALRAQLNSLSDEFANAAPPAVHDSQAPPAESRQPLLSHPATSPDKGPTSHSVPDKTKR